MNLAHSLASTATLSLLLVGCAHRHAQGGRSAVEAPSGASPGPALWRLADEDTTIYLFGTVHALPPGVQWMDERVSRAFESSDQLVLEIALSDLAASGQVFAEAGLLPQDENLRELMSEEDRREFEAALASVGMPAEGLDRMEPWFAAMTLSMIPLASSAYDMQNGVELVLTSRLEERTQAGLETLDQHLAALDGLPLEAQLVFLAQTVETLPDATTSIDAMVADWMEGDVDGLAALLHAGLPDPRLREKLLFERNARWAEWIDERLEAPGTVFVAVGAGHLAGEGSVQDYLAQRGLAVERVWQ